jgi:hypothetical protein
MTKPLPPWAAQRLRGPDPSPLRPDLAPPDTRPPPDPRLDLYLAALRDLAQGEHWRAWRANYQRFLKWDDARRLRWIAYIERHATAEPPLLPLARTLYLAVLTLRMTS